MRNDPRYRQAGQLYRQGKPTEALSLLHQLQQADADDLDVRHAIAMCHTELGNAGEARRHLEFIVAQDPERHEDVYRLACLLEEAGETVRAKELYQRLVAGGGYRDARERLAAHDLKAVRAAANGEASPAAAAPAAARATSGAAPAPTMATVAGAPAGLIVNGQHPWAPPPVQEYVMTGPDSARAVIEASNNTSRGQHVVHLRQRLLYRLPNMLKGLVTAVAELAAALLFSVAARRLSDDWLQAASSPQEVRAVLGWLAGALLVGTVVTALGVVGWQWLNARLYTLDVYERGFELSTGILPRRRTYYWYLNVTNDSTYLRDNIWSYLTGTATLQMQYDNGGSSNEDVTLEGLGTSKTMLTLKEYLERRRLPERRDFKNSWAT